MTNHDHHSRAGRVTCALPLLVASTILATACSKGTASPSTAAPTSNTTSTAAAPNAVAPPRDPAGDLAGSGVPSPTAIHTTPVADTTLSAEQLARVKAIRDREMAIVTRDPSFKAYVARGVAGVTDPEVAYARGVAMGRVLSERGMARLSDAQLQRWMQIRLALVLASAQSCAGLWAGNMPDEVFVHALASLDDDELAEFSHLVAEATLAELHAKAPLVQDRDAIAAGVAALGEQLTPDDRLRFDGVLRGTLVAADDHCFASRVLHERTAWIEPGLQARFVRALAASIAEP